MLRFFLSTTTYGWYFVMILLVVIITNAHSNDVAVVVEEESATNDKMDESSSSSSSSSCQLYLAPSTIPGAGMGVFYAGNQPLRKGDEVSATIGGDIMIPIENIKQHNRNNELRDDYIWLWKDYIWDKESILPDIEQDIPTEIINSHLDIASPGIGAMLNSFIPFVNVDEGNDENYDYTLMDNAGLISSNQSPSVGSFTPYYNRKWYAKTYIPSGMELFLDYGPNYFQNRGRKRNHKDYSKYKTMPLPIDYKRADILIMKYQRLYVKHCQASITAINKLNNKSNDRNGSDHAELLERAKIEAMECVSMFKDGWKFLLQDIKSIWDDNDYPSPTFQALPNNEKDLKRIVNNFHPATDDVGSHMNIAPGNTAKHPSISNMHYKRSIRDVNWLKQHGTCIDNIKTDDNRVSSTIPNAGRGAYATRPIQKGSIVTTTPLIHIPNGREIFKMNHDNDNNNRSRQQLLLNYCFGHVYSTLMLCPYGMVTSLINHASSRRSSSSSNSSSSGGGRVDPLPNVKLQWSKNSNV